MNGPKWSGKYYTLDTILTTLVNEYDLAEDGYLKLHTAGKEGCLIGGYTVHIHQFGMNIPMVETKLNELFLHRLRDE